jgi:hypothetical protein
MLPTKLTLRIEEELIKKAKDYSKKQGKSLSQLVADYFSLLNQNTIAYDNHIPTTPLVNELKGCLKNLNVNEQNYYKHLEDKYL